jgi:hypothetical protein
MRKHENILDAIGIIEGTIQDHGFECGLTFCELRKEGFPVSIECQKEVSLQFAQFQAKMNKVIAKDALKNTRYANTALYLTV